MSAYAIYFFSPLVTYKTYCSKKKEKFDTKE